MGSAKVGKSSVIAQFLYNRFSPKYKRTVEEMHQGNFCVSGVGLILDILDTSGAYEVSTMGESVGNSFTDSITSNWQNAYK